MICPKCQTRYTDGTRFCMKCGVQLVDEAPQQNYAAPQQNYAAPQQNYAAPRPAYAARPTGALKTKVASPVLLVAVIAYTVSVVFTLLAALIGGSSLFNSLISRVTEYSGADLGTIFKAITVLNRASVLSAIITNIPAIVICVGLWLIVVAARSKTGNGMSPVGVLLIKIIEIIKAVVFGIIMVLMLVLVIIAWIAAAQEMRAYGGYATGGYGTAVMVGLLIGLLVAAGIGVFYYSKVIRMLQGIHLMSKTCKPNQAASKTVAVTVFAFILAAGSLLTMFQGGFHILAAIGEITAYICIGIFLIGLRSWILTAQNQPAVQPTPAAAAAPQAPWQNGNGGFTPAAANNAGYNQAANNMNYHQAAAPAGTGAYNQAPVMNTPVRQNVQNDPGTTVLGNPGDDFGNTTLLSSPGPQVSAVLVRTGTGERVDIRKSEFGIGKVPGKNDYAVTGNPAISRTHAMIHCRQGKFFIEDLNSSNHVYVNGNQIAPGSEQVLSNGDTVYLADEEFRFEC